MTAQQQSAYRRTLGRGLGFLTLGVGFALPIVGSVAGRGVNLLLSAVGYRYGFRLEIS